MRFQRVSIITVTFETCMHSRLLVPVIFVCFLIGKASAQTDSKNQLLQFSGVVVSNDSLKPIPYTSVMIRHASRGTITDFYGFFSFVAMKGDTVDFNFIGYKPEYFVIPDTLTGNRYSLIQVLSRDTILLKEAIIYPWPSREEFKRAFVELEIPDDDLKRAQRNFELAQTREAQESVPYDGSINWKFTQNQHSQQLYNAGMYQSSNIFNPLAWAAFIKAWQEGAFKQKDKDK
jgi:hypothetical protein